MKRNKGILVLRRHELEQQAQGSETQTAKLDVSEVIKFLEGEGMKDKEVQRILDRERTKAIQSNIEKNMEKYKSEGKKEAEDAYKAQLDELNNNLSKVTTRSQIEKSLIGKVHDGAIDDVVSIIMAKNPKVENGKVIGAEDYINDLKTSKPFFFMTEQANVTTVNTVGASGIPSKVVAKTNLSVDDQIAELQKSINVPGNAKKIMALELSKLNL